MNLRTVNKIYLICIFLLCINSISAQIDYRMNIRFFGGYQFGEDLKAPDEITTEVLVNQMPTFGAELGFNIKRNFNLYINLKGGSLLNSLTYLYNYTTVSAGLKYYFKPKSLVSPYFFGDINFSIHDLTIVPQQMGTVYDSNGNSTQAVVGEYTVYYDFYNIAGSIGIGAMINMSKSKRTGLFMQASYFSNGFINDYCFEAGLNIKFIRKIE